MRILVKKVKQRQRRISSDLNQVIHEGEKLALDKEILLIENRQLQQALNQGNRVQSIREDLVASEASKKDEQACKEDAKLQRAILKEQREADLIQQRMEREAARQAAKQQIEMDKAARAAQRQIDKQGPRAKRKGRTGCSTVAITVGPSISQRVAKSRFQSPARVLPEDSDDIAIPTDLMTACLLNLLHSRFRVPGELLSPTNIF
ncbi:hypothetical protein ACJ73_09805 [Blastomyces percursus]|uniref:Uncharacterized protein n=1 Tax=Blastomyces percursus TaxID=1658174 RepID=A0A1J9P2K3_9EURO|nr:hypothetical protein ACJ73_09805 [Blastomyces percursus]